MLMWSPAGPAPIAPFSQPTQHRTGDDSGATRQSLPSAAMKYYCLHALGPASRQLYAVGQRHNANLCRLHNRPPSLATDTTFSESVACLADATHIAPTSINAYLLVSAVRSLHIDPG